MLPPMNRRLFLHLLAGSAALTLAGAPAARAAQPTINTYRNPGCGCCEAWVDAMREAGFTVTMQDDENLTARAEKLAIPQDLLSCHVAVIGEYILSGHVPPEDVQRLLTESPAIIGLAVPGMPVGSPGMEGSPVEPYKVIAFAADGTQSVYATYNYI
jgi:hypothetical protein